MASYGINLLCSITHYTTTRDAYRWLTTDCMRHGKG